MGYLKCGEYDAKHVWCLISVHPLMAIYHRGTQRVLPQWNGCLKWCYILQWWFTFNGDLSSWDINGPDVWNVRVATSFNLQPGSFHTMVLTTKSLHTRDAPKDDPQRRIKRDHSLLLWIHFYCYIFSSLDSVRLSPVNGCDRWWHRGDIVSCDRLEAAIAFDVARDKN